MLTSALKFVEAHANKLIWATAGMLLILSIAKASVLPLWFDEYMTLFVASRHNFSQMAACMKAGADSVPPYFHYIQKLALATGLPPEISLRLLPALAVTAAFLCLYYLLAPRCGKMAALGGAITPLACGAFEYAQDARPYGMLIGSAGAAILAWTRLDSSRLAAPFLTLALAIGTLAHPFGIFVTFSLIASEAFLSFMQNRWRSRAWVAFLAATATALVHLPFLLHARQNFATHFFASASFGAFYSSLKHTFFKLWLILIPLALIPALLEFWSNNQFFRKAPSQMPRYRYSHAAESLVAEATLGIAFLILLPTATWIAFRIFGGGITARYILPSTLGAGLLVALATARASRIFHFAVFAALLFTVAERALSGLSAVQATKPTRLAGASEEVIRILESQKQGMVVVHNAELFLRCWRFLPEEAFRHVYFVADPEMAVKWSRRRSDSIDATMAGFGKTSGAKVLTYRGLMHASSEFLLISANDDFEWLPSKLMSDGCMLQVRWLLSNHYVFEAKCPWNSARNFSANSFAVSK